MKNIIKILSVVVIIFIFSVMSWIGFTIFGLWYYQHKLAPPIQKELGFKHGSPYVNIEGSMVEVFTLHPLMNGSLSKAGIKDGDIVISESITSFYKLLSKSHGKKVTIIVVNGGDGLPLDKRRRRAVDIIYSHK